MVQFFKKQFPWIVFQLFLMMMAFGYSMVSEAKPAELSCPTIEIDEGVGFVRVPVGITLEEDERIGALNLFFGAGEPTQHVFISKDGDEFERTIWDDTPGKHSNNIFDNGYYGVMLMPDYGAITSCVARIKPPLRLTQTQVTNRGGIVAWFIVFTGHLPPGEYPLYPSAPNEWGVDTSADCPLTFKNGKIVVNEVVEPEIPGPPMPNEPVEPDPNRPPFE